MAKEPREPQGSKPAPPQAPPRKRRPKDRRGEDRQQLPAGQRGPGYITKG